MRLDPIHSRILQGLSDSMKCVTGILACHHLHGKPETDAESPDDLDRRPVDNAKREKLAPV